MTLSELEALIGALCNDANHDRYPLSAISVELDNTQDAWNISAKIVKDAVTITVADGVRQYALSGLTGTPISFPRVTHKGLNLEKRSKTWFDLYSGVDFTTVNGTPSDYFIEAEDPNYLYLTVYPTPTSEDAGANLVVEYIKRHTSMASGSDVPFMSGSVSNYLLRPYDYGLAYDVAARLLNRDPSQESVKKSVDYKSEANNVLANVIQVFKNLEKEEPPRLRGGRYWNQGTFARPF
jgi:hypothetical protein